MKNYEKLWTEYLNLNFQNIFDGLEYQDYRKDEKTKIAMALCLWKFSRTLDSNTTRRAFFAPFVAHRGYGSVFSFAVAVVESLPDRVWRRLLWKENFDFSSREAFLRRLTGAHLDALLETYRCFDETVQKMPQVMKTLWMRIKLLFSNEAQEVEKLLEEPYDDVNRSQSKGAWAFNLLGLDFGFSLYPNGDNDDTEITNQRWTRFLSVKNHINDFIVNMEFGKYWFFYRTARSNYAFRPNRKVDLRTHICPGFWMTFILHLLFWVVSPALAIIFNVHVITDWDLWRIPFNVLALVTPLWLVAALIKAFFIYAVIPGAVSIFSLFGVMYESEKWSKVWEKIKIVLWTLATCVSIYGIYKSSSFLFMEIAKLWTVALPVIGPSLFVLSLLDILYFLIILAVAIVKDGFYWYEDMPKIIRWTAIFIPATLALKLFDAFLLSYVVQACIWIWDVLSSAPSLTFATVFMLLSFVGSLALIIMAEKNERVFAGLNKLINVIVLSGIIIPTVLILVHIDFSLLKGGFSLFLSTIPSFILLFFLITIMVVVILLFERMIINEYTVDAREKFKNIASESDFLFYKDWKHLFARKALDDELDRVFDFSIKWFEDDIIRRRFALLALSLQKLPNLEQFGNYIKKIEDDEDKFFFMKFIFEGNKPKKALILLKESKETRSLKEKKMEALREKIGNFFGAIIDFFETILDGIVWFFRQIGRFFLTLKDIWELFNERCPYVSRSKYLD